MRRFAVCGAVVLALSAASASAQDGWVQAGMLGADRHAVDVQLGWPGVTLGYWGGQSDHFDLGTHVSFSYFFQGDTQGPLQFQPTVEGGVDLKLRLAGSDGPVLLFLFHPGLAGDFDFGGANVTLVMLSLPLELRVGVPLSPSLRLHAGVVVPLGFGATYDGGQWLGYLQCLVEPGAGLEWSPAHGLGVTLDVRAGPLVHAGMTFDNPTVGPWSTDFAFAALVGVEYQY